MNASGRNMYVFRDGRRSVPGATLLAGLTSAVQRLGSAPEWFTPQFTNLLLDALLRAGELECALADAASPQVLRLSRLTDLLAKMLVGAPCSRPTAAQMLELVPSETPNTVPLSPPEGFAYYALHPLDFADLAAGMAVSGGHVAVVGIRSIGTTLSAMVVAALAKRGLHAERISVRPAGHPYDRRTEFSPAQLRWIAQGRADDADFVVVDEGPGMSGSSFLSVGEALLAAGVARSRVQFLCSREPDVNVLCARDAAARWSGFRSLFVKLASHLPLDAKLYIGGGYWRHELIGHDVSLWPASWSQMERVKFLSPDRTTLFKFEGLGRFGEEIRCCAQILGESGYAIAPRESVHGFGAYDFVPGKILTSADVSQKLLEHLANYCAFRQQALRSSQEPNDDQMSTMVRFNVAEEFGVQLNGDFGSLPTEHPVFVDGRMLPHEWVRATTGRLVKCDGASHGDDHFFPGPATDIAWDLAGAVVEWDLWDNAKDYFIECYRRASGDDPRHRLPAFLIAYAVFRFAYCKMAAAVMHGTEEEQRLLQAYRYYRQRAGALLTQRELLAAD